MPRDIKGDEVTESGYRDEARSEPMPQVLPGKRGGDWKVVEDAAHPRTDFRSKRMFVDTSDTAAGRRGRSHEFHHAAYTNDKIWDEAIRTGKVNSTVLQKVEDAHIQLRAVVSGFPGYEENLYAPVDFEKMVRSGSDPERLGLSLIAMVGTIDFDLACDAVATAAGQAGVLQTRYTKAVELARVVDREMNQAADDGELNTGKAIEVATTITKILAANSQLPEDDPTDTQPQPGPEGCGGDEDGTGYAEADDEDGEADDDSEEALPGKPADETRERDEEDADEDGEGDGSETGDEEDADEAGTGSGSGDEDDEDADEDDEGAGTGGGIDETGQDAPGEDEATDGTSDEDGDDEADQTNLGSTEEDVAQTGHGGGTPEPGEDEGLGDDEGFGDDEDELSLSDLADDTTYTGTGWEPHDVRGEMVPDGLRDLFDLPPVERRTLDDSRKTPAPGSAYTPPVKDADDDPRNKLDTGENIHLAGQWLAWDPIAQKAESCTDKATAFVRATEMRNNLKGGRLIRSIRARRTLSLRWGDMIIQRAPLARRWPGRWKKATQSYSDQGCVPGAMHRLCIDQKVFNDRASKASCPTILVDLSGSMSLNQGQVEAICKAHPYATIATYSGGYHKGILRIVVEKSRVAKTAYLRSPHGGGNTVDGPALRWLAKQPGPRIWVSDGGIFGSDSRGGGRSPEELKLEVKDTLREAHIRQLADPESVTPYLKECSSKGKIFLARPKKVKDPALFGAARRTEANSERDRHGYVRWCKRLNEAPAIY